MNKKIVVIRCKALLPSDKLDSLEEKLRKEYETGFMFVPCYCEVLIADGVKTEIVGRERRPQGEWIDYSEEGFVECPFCHKATTCEDNIDELHYCWNCGAKMKGGAECSQTEK